MVRIPPVRGPSTVAKAYRLLKTILSTAVADELLVRNPCVPRGAASERTPERRPPTLAEVDALATAIAPRWRMLVVFAAWSGLRWGELVGLTRQRVDLLHGTLTIAEQLAESDAGVFLGPPKTDAGRRVVHLPPHLLSELAVHLDEWVGTAPDAWMFCGPKGAPLVRSNFTHHWSAACRVAGRRRPRHTVRSGTRSRRSSRRSVRRRSSNSGSGSAERSVAMSRANWSAKST